MVCGHELTDEQWHTIEPLLPPWKTVYTRFWRWSRDGTLTMLVSKVRVVAEAVDELDREVSVDSSIVRAHRHAAGARRTTVSLTGGGPVVRRAQRAR
ncbi:hypothetical protein CLV43_111303 [Umezawaea tangerina]|uniref:Uncharacterized protein n=1 Tax=Umezawaea tangerina TaxID=84725 RepID=A0A2T0SU35_9PSEU|nr:hypothetical protein CLV43_111303 [Umezawaea tangerina]